MGWGASDIDPAGKAVVTGAYAPALREVRRVRAAAPASLFFLCQLFDLLLTDYQDFELLRRTKGRREVTEADEKAVEKLCQPYLDWRKEALK